METFFATIVGSGGAGEGVAPLTWGGIIGNKTAS